MSIETEFTDKDNAKQFRRLISPTGVFIMLLVAAAAAMLRPSIRGNDGVQNYVFLRSMLFDGDLDFWNEYEYYFGREPEWFDQKRLLEDPVTGRPINLYGIGNSTLWTPWVLLFHGGGQAASAAGFPVTLDGYSRLYEWAVGVGSCFYATLGLILLLKILRRTLTEETGVWAVIAVWLATPLIFYMYLHPSMSHANSFFLTALLLFIYLSRDGIAHWTLMGGIWALLALVRFQDGAFLLPLAVGELLRLRGQSAGVMLRERLPRYGAFALAACIVFLPQLLVWKILQGSAFSGPRAYLVNGEIRLWAPVHLWEVAFSSFHGVFFWHPILLIAFIGLFRPGAEAREKLIALTAFVTQWWIVSSWSIWWAGASFGHRMFISCLPFLAFGMASMLETGRRFRTALRILILFFIAWNFGYIVQYGIGMIPRQKPVPLITLIRNNVIEVPKKLLGL